MVKKVSKKLKPTSQKPEAIYDVCIIGGGPAGLMAAGAAGAKGAKVILLEKNEILGKKLLISGGGRCNMTNANPDHRDFVNQYGLSAQAGKKGNYLFSPFSRFGVPETIKFFNDLGVKTKVENNFRVFPESDKSADVLNALVKYAEKNKVEFRIGAEVLKFKKLKNKITSVVLKDSTEIKAKSFILAVGGKSHPETGSTGDGFTWLTELGHKVAEGNPSLVPIKISNPWVSELSGITLDNVGISVWVNSQSRSDLKSEKRSVLDFQKVLSKKGRLLFTHVGISGPTVLNMSRLISEYLEYGEVLVSVDFFPGVGLDQMHEMMKKTFDEHINKKIKNLVFKEVPNKIFDLILKQLKIDPEWNINEIRREERMALVEKFKKFEMKVAGLLGFDKAIISSGGLDLNEVDFKTMGSRLYQNLYFAGDILDFDRPSGGFSLQLCWTTGYIAGLSAGQGLTLS